MSFAIFLPVDTNISLPAHLLGEELYQNLIKYLDRHLQGVYEGAQRTGEDSILTFYIKEWKRYTTAATYNNHLFRYLNRHWVKREMDEGKKNVFDIYTLHLVRWKEDMFAKTQDDVMSAVLRLVQRQRNGETIEHSQIKSIVDSFGMFFHSILDRELTLTARSLSWHRRQRLHERHSRRLQNLF